MPLGEKKRHLDEQVAAAVRQAVDNLQREMRSRLAEATEQLQRSLGEITPHLPESFVPEADLLSLTEEAAATARAEALASVAAAVTAPAPAADYETLRDAIASLDRGHTQAEVLSALLESSTHFCGRAAILLVRGDAATGWSARGFEGDVRHLRLEVDQAPWSELAADGATGSGTRSLSAVECGSVASALDSALPHHGLALALVLRDRVAAIVYADASEGQPWVPTALQILTWAAAQSLETLAFRGRRATATLGSLGASSAAFTAAAVPEPEPEPEPVPEPVAAPAPWYAPVAVAAPVLEAPEVPEPPPAAEPVSAFDSEGVTFQIEEEEPAFAAPAEPAFTERAPEPAFTFEPIEPEPAVELPPVLALEETPAVPSLGGFADFDDESFQLPSVGAEPPAPVVAAAISLETAGVVVPDDLEATVEPPPAPTFPRSGAETVLMPTFSGDIDLPSPLAPVPEPPPAPAPTPIAVAAPEPSPLGDGDDGSGAGAGGQVQPPSDLDGPGWAFSTTRVPISKGDEAMHEEARRLARLLVSEIHLYNESQVAEGRQRRDIYERLREDIERSRVLYDDRVDASVRETTDYFYQELVRQLAAGDAGALGI